MQATQAVSIKPYLVLLSKFLSIQVLINFRQKNWLAGLAKKLLPKPDNVYKFMRMSCDDYR